MLQTLCHKKVKILKHKNNGMYLLNTDIEELNERYSILYKKVKNDTNLSNEQRDRECEILLGKYNFEIEELNAFREVEYKTQQAKIEARNQEEIPWRRCWLWRLLLKPVTNRAQDIIEEEAARNAEERFTPMEKELISRAIRIYNFDIKKFSPRKRKKILKRYFNNKNLLEIALQIIDESGTSEESNKNLHAAQSEGAETVEQNAAELATATSQQEEPVAPSEGTETVEEPDNQSESDSVQTVEQNAAEPATAASQQEEPAAQSEGKETPAEPPKKRHHHKKKETPSETLPAGTETEFEEVQTAMGAQIRLQIP